MLRNKCRKRCRDLWENMGVNSCQHMYDRRYVGMCRDCTSQASFILPKQVCWSKFSLEGRLDVSFTINRILMWFMGRGKPEKLRTAVVRWPAPDMPERREPMTIAKRPGSQVQLTHGRLHLLF